MKNFLGLEYMGHHIPLSTLERQRITDQVRFHIEKMNLENIIEIKKLQIMLNLFEQFGREFDRHLPVPSLDRRLLEVKLYNDKQRTCSIVLRRTKSD